jgi:hypothetical protein
MKLICKLEDLMPNGKKHMCFTKGNVYEATENDEDGWSITDDNGKSEEFWNIEIMFKPID